MNTKKRINQIIFLIFFVISGCNNPTEVPNKVAGSKTEQKTKTSSSKDIFNQLLKNAESGDSNAQYELAKKYIDGENILVDKNKGLSWLKKAADKDNNEAQNLLGTYYVSGFIVEKDYIKSVEWFKKAIENGSSKAMVNMSNNYAKGLGVKKDYKKCFELTERAALLGDANAMYALGNLYYEGLCIAKDIKKHIEWIRKAALAGDADGMNSLGMSYLFGDGVDVDEKKAAEWFEKAVAKNHTDAMINLSSMYQEGTVFVKDESKAFELRLAAAILGNSIAQVELGLNYESGYFLPKDNVLAYAWLSIAATDRNRSIGVSVRDQLDLSLEERKEAQRISAKWKKGQLLERETAPAFIAGNTKDLSKISTGTGFVIDTQNHLITNAHVVDQCAEVRLEGIEGSLTIKAKDEVNDLALLLAPTSLSYSAQLAPNQNQLGQGEDVIVFGYPWKTMLSSGGNLTNGVVSGITGLDNNSSQFQFTAQIQPGSSGSPVINHKGYIIGVVTNKLSDIAMVKYSKSVPQNVNFAVSLPILRAFLDANKVQFSTGMSWFSFKKDFTSIADEARKWTFVVECWG